MSVDIAKQKLFEEYIRWREDEGKDALVPDMMFYGWVRLNRHDLIKELSLFTPTGYQEISNWAQSWERARK